MGIGRSLVDTVVNGSNPQLYKFVVSLSTTFHPHCFSRHRLQMSTRWGHPHDFYLLSAMSFPEEIALINHRIFLKVQGLCSVIPFFISQLSLVDVFTVANTFFVAFQHVQLKQITILRNYITMLLHHIAMLLHHITMLLHYITMKTCLNMENAPHRSKSMVGVNQIASRSKSTRSPSFVEDAISLKHWLLLLNLCLM